MAAKLRFRYDDLETFAEGTLDTRGRRGLADVPVHYQAVKVRIRIRTTEPDTRVARLADLVGRYCPVDSLLEEACAQYELVWERAD